jgi:hypothetical protein
MTRLAPRLTGGYKQNLIQDKLLPDFPGYGKVPVMDGVERTTEHTLLH